MACVSYTMVCIGHLRLDYLVTRIFFFTRAQTKLTSITLVPNRASYILEDKLEKSAVDERQFAEYCDNIS